MMGKPYLALALVGIAACHAASLDPVTDRMKALFSQSDADRDGVLSPAEQEQATASVKDAYGETWARRIRSMFAHAATPADRSVAHAAWLAQIEAYARPPVKETVLIPMRDGKCLATDIYRPCGGGPFPVLLSRTPYSRRKHAPPEGGYTRDGYAYVIQDMRGRFDSDGENLPFVGCGWGEHQDGADTVAWLRKQPWCDGNIGTVGGSAGGITQNLLAGAAPEGLKAQYVSVAAADLYADAVYTGGALRKADAEGWIVGNGFDPRAMENIRAHPSYDGYWQTLDTTRKFPRMTVPAVHVGGWFDMFAQATINEFAGRQHAGGVGARGAQKLVMGPWTHAVGHMPVGDLRFPDADRVPERYGPERWFAHTLCGDDNGIDNEPAVMYYVMGDAKTPGAPGNEWRTATDWPVPATETAAYLTRDGGLAFERPDATVEACREYVFCPTNPCPTIGGNNLNLARGPMNQNRIESRGDVVLFTSTPLAKPLEVTGRVRAAVFVSSSALDTDLSVRLCDVYPDGTSYLIAEGLLRLRHRHSMERAEPLMPGRIEEVVVDCWSTSIVFNKGHRIRATVTSGNYPRFDVNPGTGVPWSDSGAWVSQTNRFYCGGAHPSRLLLPVVGTSPRAAPTKVVAQPKP